MRNLAAWGAGAMVAVLIAVFARPGAAIVALCAAPLGIAATFLSPDLDSVHRWIDLGPAHLNAALLLLPASVVAQTALAGARRWPWPWLAVLVALGLLAAQPDASQATALGGTAALIAAVTIRHVGLRLLLIAAVACLVALTWLRPDPVAPVAEVEGIIGLAAALSPMAAGLALVLLAGVAAAPVACTVSGPPALRLAGMALGLCLLVWAAMPFAGAFPVPLVGMGMSPIIGAWLGVGLLASLQRQAED
jgi:cell division protein FtsW (lipid II flippase)